MIAHAFLAPRHPKSGVHYFRLRQHGTLSLLVYRFSPYGAKNDTQELKMTDKRKPSLYCIVGRFFAPAGKKKGCPRGDRN
jgi:hypothetical protein